jgi:N-ethylmaleimide reductase
MQPRPEQAFPVPQRLFTPFDAGALRLPNRMVMAPMTRNRAGSGGVPTPLMARYYRQRATAGLIVTEGTQVSLEGVGYPGTPGIHTGEQVAAWRQIVDEVHSAGGRIVLQLWHVGRISHPSFQPSGALPIAPSAIRPDGQAFTAEGLQPFQTPRALETQEIDGVVQQFAAGARRAKEAGFDGVEIHGANGYLIDQFLRDGSNCRTDQYGGSLAHRLRFLLEVTEAVVDVWGEGRVGVRLSPTSPFNDMRDSDPVSTFSAAARALSGQRLAYLHVIEAGPGNANATFASAAPRTLPSIARAFHGPLIVNDGYTAETAEATLVRGEADLVSFGSPFLANPDLVERFRAGLPLNAPDRSTFYGGDERGYTDYPPFDPASREDAAA